MNALVVQQHNVTEMERMAVAFAGSKLFGIATPDQALALCLIAQAEGRHPASAAQDYHIIQGKPSKKSDAMLRDFLNSGGKVQWHSLTDELVSATFSHPAGGTVTIDWNMERAKQAQISTPMWKKYPRQMLRARVVSEGVRTVFPMATSGMYVPEEVAEFVPQDQPRDVTPETPQFEGKKSKSAHASKSLGADMIAEMRACQTEEDLNLLWNSKPFRESFDSLPASWREGYNSLTAEKDELVAILRGEHPSQSKAPDFDTMDGNVWKASVAVEKIAAEFRKAETPTQLAALWDAKVQAPEGSDAALYLTGIYAGRLRELGVTAE